MKAFKCILSYAIALIAPVIFFSLTNAHESHPALPFFTIPFLFAIAGAYTNSVTKVSDVDDALGKWIVSSFLIGIVEAAIIVFGA